MKELDYLKSMERVKAPDNFEQNIMARISERKKKKKRAHIFRLSLAGAVSTAGVILLVFNLFVFNGKKSMEIAEKGRINIQDTESYYQFGRKNQIPITEAVDYSGEINSRNKQPRTIYILEQVSESTDTYIKY